MVDDRFFGWFPLTQHEIYLTAAREVIAQTETQTTEHIGTQFFNDVGQAVVAAVSTLLAEAQRTQRQSDVIVDNQKILNWNLLLLQPVFYRLAAEIHVGRRLDDKQSLALEFHLRSLGKTVRGERTFQVLRQAVGNLKTNVVSRVVVLGTYVSQTGNQVFHVSFAGFFIWDWPTAKKSLKNLFYAHISLDIFELFLTDFSRSNSII